MNRHDYAAHIALRDTRQTPPPYRYRKPRHTSRKRHPLTVAFCALALIGWALIVPAVFAMVTR